MPGAHRLAMQGRDARCPLARLQVQHSARAVQDQDAVITQVWQTETTSKINLQLRPWSR